MGSIFTADFDMIAFRIPAAVAGGRRGGSATRGGVSVLYRRAAALPRRGRVGRAHRHPLGRPQNSLRKTLTAT